MGATPRGKAIAIGLIASAILVPGAVRYYQVTRAHDADLVITGQTSSGALPVGSNQIPNPSAPGDIPVMQPEIGPAREIAVYISGAVAKPGVYRLPGGSRTEDVVKSAGGPTKSADLSAINLALRLEDEAHIHVPAKGEQVGLPNGGRTTGAGGPTSEGGTRSEKLTAPGSGTVNINTASAEELQRLPRVGPAMASKIIDYRKSVGSFAQPEALMDVAGIGPKTFEKMKPFLRVK